MGWQWDGQRTKGREWPTEAGWPRKPSPKKERWDWPEGHPLQGQEPSWLCWCFTQILFFYMEAPMPLLLWILAANCSQPPLLQRLAQRERICPVWGFTALAPHRDNLQPMADWPRGTKCCLKNRSEHNDTFLPITSSWLGTSKDVFLCLPMKIIDIWFREEGGEENVGVLCLLASGAGSVTSRHKDNPRATSFKIPSGTKHAHFLLRCQ